ncbi:MAG: V-type ATP synthase subunit B [Candidatus Schekmanbacteria bacterium]|nr:V-type ATP synthase subunit B [Candidatus Schekmanbacteria bacterium]
MKRIYQHIEQITGPVVMLRAKGIAYGELARIRLGDGATSYAQTIKLRDDQVTLQVFAGSKGVSTGDEVEFLGHQVELMYAAESILGRTFSGVGEPIDGRPPVQDAEKVEIGGPSFNPARRIVPTRMIQTGIPMIDMFNSLVESQKLPIFSVAGEPYNPLLARIALQAEADVIIVGGMGLKYDDYLFFRDKLAPNKERTIMFIHTASDPVVECIMVPDMALAAAERYATANRRVLVLLTDMTAFSDAMKEVAVAMEQIPANRGYPGDLYSQLAARYEKAVDIEGSGSITILAVTTMPGDDVTHPVPDNTGYITEGQFYLKNGVIDPFGSLSRLKQIVNKRTREDHAPLMNAMIQLYDSCRKVRQQQSMGFSISDFDQKLLAYGEEFERRMMDLEVNLPLQKQLDLGWEILANHFTPQQAALSHRLIEAYWPKSRIVAA